MFLRALRTSTRFLGSSVPRIQQPLRLYRGFHSHRILLRGSVRKPAPKPESPISQLNALIRQKDLKGARKLHDALPSPLDENLTRSLLIAYMAMDPPDVKNAESLLNSLVDPDEKTLLTLVVAYTQTNAWDAATKLFETLKDPSQESISTFLGAVTNHGKMTIAESLYSRLTSPNEAVKINMCEGYCQMGDMANAERIYDSFTDPSYELKLLMLHLYANLGEVDKAELLFTTIETPEDIELKMMMHLYCVSGKPQLAESFCHRMEVVDDHINTMLMWGFAQKGYVSKTQVLFNTLQEASRDDIAHAILILAYGHAGDVITAQKIFDDYRGRGAQCYKELLRAYDSQPNAQTEYAEKIMKLIEEAHVIYPDAVEEFHAEKKAKTD